VDAKVGRTLGGASLDRHSGGSDWTGSMRELDCEEQGYKQAKTLTKGKSKKNREEPVMAIDREDESPGISLNLILGVTPMVDENRQREN